LDGKTLESKHESSNENRTELFSLGLYEALRPAVEECDDNIRGVLTSQEVLAGHIERLAAVLSTFGDNPKMPGLAPYTTKLSNSRKRLTKINASVARINARLEEIRASVRRKEVPIAKRMAVAAVQVTTKQTSAEAASAPSSQEASSSSSSEHDTKDKPESIEEKNETSESAASIDADDSSSTIKTQNANEETQPSKKPLSAAAILELLEWD